MATFYTPEEIRLLKESNRIPDNATLFTAPDGTLIWARPGITADQLGLNNKLPDGTYDRSRYAISGVYLVVPPPAPPPSIQILPPDYTGPVPPIQLPDYTNIAPPPPPVSNGSQYLQIRVGVYSPPRPAQINIIANLDVFPAIPTFSPDNISIDWELLIRPIPIALTNSVIAAARRLLQNKIASYFDEDRVGKTLLNFGEDYQMPIVNWQYDESEPTGRTILVKTYRPLPTDAEVFSELWIDRELSPSLIDQLYVVFIPGEGLRVYLRPPNRNINVRALDGNEINNVTLSSLFTTSSFDVAKPNDPIINEWYVTSLEGAELNIDYTNFSNFVFYSSAKARIQAFKQKLLTIENYDAVIAQQSSSIATITTGLSGFTSSVSYPTVLRIAQQREELIRSFDGFERHLYYASGSQYSSSFSDIVDQLYFMKPFEWPKVNGSVISVASASNANLYPVLVGPDVLPAPEDGGFGFVSWLDAIEYIAEEYDRQNQNRLVNNLPEYLVNDPRSQDFIKFMDLVGHHFDILKAYADAMPDIYDRNSNPFVGLSMDMIWSVAESVGISLPNQYAVKALVDYTIGEIGQVSPKIYRQVAAETWKRFLHNHIYLAKSKGTKQALRGLLNAYGVLPTTIQIRETATPSFYTTQSYEIIEEQTNALKIPSGSFVQIPWSGSGLEFITTVQTRFATTTATRSVLYNVDKNWSLQLIPVSRSFGRVAYVSGTTVAATSSVFPVYDGTFYSTTLQRTNNSINLWVQQTDDDGDFTYNSYVTSSINSVGIWGSGTILYLGSSGTIPTAQPFAGLIDEFRMWTEVLSPDTINFHTKYPGLYNGNTVSSARDSLPVRLSFNKPRNLGSVNPLNRFVLNETPYIRAAGRSNRLLQFSASAFPNETSYPNSMEVITRNVLRFAPNAGGSQYVTNKVTIADPPVFRTLNDDSGSGIPVLSHKKSMVTIEQKENAVQSNNIIGFFFSITDAINDNIIRSVGNVDIQDYIGDPSNLYEVRYKDLDEINKLYWSNYAYNYNYNSFVEFVDTLLAPLFKQAEQFVPARAKLLTGIVLEPHILERNKIQWKKIDISGKGTFEENVNPTLEADPFTSQPSVIQASYNVQTAILEQPISSEVIVATYDIFDARYDMSETDQPRTDWLTYETTFEAQDEEPIQASFDTFEATKYGLDGIDDLNTDFFYIDDAMSVLNYQNFLLQRFRATSIAHIPPQYQAAFIQLLVTYTPGSNISINTGLNSGIGENFYVSPIEPYIDFSDIGVVNYFTQRDGIFLVETQKQVRVGENSLTSAGIWNKGSTYIPGQYVTQSNQVGAAESGNGFEYVCITPLRSGSFISYNPPSLDTDNWRRTKYTTVPAYDVRVVSRINGKLELVNSGSGYTPFVGYINEHYRFRRDTRLGTLRRIWLGCKQSDDTTFDGGPAVEIIPSAGDILFVSTGAEPVQRRNDNAGPILDVR
jgi:hypothetical protein